MVGKPIHLLKEDARDLHGPGWLEDDDGSLAGAEGEPRSGDSDSVVNMATRAKMVLPVQLVAALFKISRIVASSGPRQARS